MPHFNLYVPELDPFDQSNGTYTSATLTTLTLVEYQEWEYNSSGAYQIKTPGPPYSYYRPLTVVAHETVNRNTTTFLRIPGTVEGTTFQWDYALPIHPAFIVETGVFEEPNTYSVNGPVSIDHAGNLLPALVWGGYVQGRCYAATSSEVTWTWKQYYNNLYDVDRTFKRQKRTCIWIHERVTTLGGIVNTTVPPTGTDDHYRVRRFPLRTLSSAKNGARINGLDGPLVTTPPAYDAGFWGDLYTAAEYAQIRLAWINPGFTDFVCVPVYEYADGMANMTAATKGPDGMREAFANQYYATSWGSPAQVTTRPHAPSVREGVSRSQLFIGPLSRFVFLAVGDVYIIDVNVMGAEISRTGPLTPVVSWPSGNKYVLKGTDFPAAAMGSFLGSRYRLIRSSGGSEFPITAASVYAFSPIMLECIIPKSYQFADSVPYFGGVIDTDELLPPTYVGTATNAVTVEGPDKRVTIHLPEVQSPYHSTANSAMYSPYTRTVSDWAVTAEIMRLDPQGDARYSDGIFSVTYFLRPNQVRLKQLRVGGFSNEFSPGFKFNATGMSCDFVIRPDASQPDYPLRIRVRVHPTIMCERRIVRRLAASPVYEMTAII